MTLSRDQLSQEERVLAERLSHLAGGGPGPALDARILSAAQDAVSSTPGTAYQPLANAAIASTSRPKPAALIRNTAHRSRRWGMGFGLAASLVIAVGIAWQLRPQHQPAVIDETTSAPRTSAAADAPSRTSTTPPVQSSITSAASATLGQALPAHTRPAPPLARTKAPTPPSKLQTSAKAEHASVRMTHIQQLRATSTPSQRGAAFADNARPSIPPQSRAVIAAASAIPASENASDAMGAAVEQDARLPADAWLRAIRRHRFEGQGALARASLQAFQTAHPEQAIPEDLRTLMP